MRALRVALVAPLVAPIDDRRGQIGGAQSVVADLARGLAQRGHRVTVLAPVGSHIEGAQIVDLGIAADASAAVRPRGGAAPAVAFGPEFAAVAEWLVEHAGDFDIVHGHAFDAPALERIQGDRVVHTLHLPPLGPEIVRAANAAWATLATVSGSCAADWRAAGVEVTELLPNGIDLDAVPFGGGRGGYLAFAGRMSPEKGPDAACRVARAVGLPLRLAGPIYDAEYFARDVEPLLGPRAEHFARDVQPLLGPHAEHFARDVQPLLGPHAEPFARDVEPLLDPSIEYLGALDRHALWALLGSARATLLPVRWNEPFGLVALESLACGTPVIGYARGGLREIVVDGRSGRLVQPDDEDALARAVRDAGGLDRGACREDAARHDLPAMLDAHERLYARIA